MPFFIFTTADKELRHQLSGYASTSKQKLKSIKKKLGVKAEIARIDVSYESVSHYLDSNDIKKLNLLVTDVEGLDIDIVTEVINCGILPNIIYMEILDQPPVICAQVIDLLTKAGYSIGGNISDLIAYRRIQEADGY